MMPSGALDVLDALDPAVPQTVTDLTDRTDNSRKHIYTSLDWLADHDLTRETRGPNNSRTITLRETPLTNVYRALTTAHSHIDWPDLLTPARTRVLWHLDTPRTAADIADSLDISTPRTHTVLKPLKERALLDPAGPTYALADNIRDALHTFIAELVAHLNTHKVHQIAPHATVHWTSPTTTLLRSTTTDETDTLAETDDYHLTGLAAFADHDLQFYLSTEPAFWRAQTPPTPTEQICHLIVLDDSPRRIGYAMLLIDHLDVPLDDLHDTATAYGLTDTINTISTALTDEYPDDPTSIPTETEYDALKSQYGVA